MRKFQHFVLPDRCLNNALALLEDLSILVMWMTCDGQSQVSHPTPRWKFVFFNQDCLKCSPGASPFPSTMEPVKCNYLNTK